MDEGARLWPFSVRLTHWVSATLVLAALGYGVYMVHVVQNAAERFELIQIHKSIGISVLAITVARLCLRVLTAAPGPEPSTPLLLTIAKTAHLALYALLVMMPLSGWLMASLTPVRIPTSVFGLFELPYPLSPALPAYRFAHAIHVASAIALTCLIILHIAAALVHQFLWRDRTVGRMWLRERSRLKAAKPISLPESILLRIENRTK